MPLVSGTTEKKARSLNKLLPPGFNRGPRPDVSDFRRQFLDWCERFWPTYTDPVYALPDSVVAWLGSAGSRSFSALSRKIDLEAERTFAAFCGREKTAGFVNGLPVLNPLFGTNLSFQKRLSYFLPEGQESRAETLSTNFASREIGVVQKAYLGKLWCTNQFLVELETLRRMYEASPLFPRLQYPLNEFTARYVNVSNEITRAAAVELGSLMAAFLGRWSLCHLPSWELPYPQGTLDTAPPLVPSRTPRFGVRPTIPTYFPVSKLDRLTDAVEALQLSEARRAGIDQSFASIDQVDVFAAKADLIHLERTIRHRFSGQVRGGLAAMIIHAAAEHLGLSTHRVEKFRKEIAAARKGNSVRKGDTNNS
jgi:hypothetical protein